MKALNSLRASLRIPEGGDIRLLIEQVIEQGVESIRKELEEKATADKVDGGKANGPSTEKDASPQKETNESLPENDGEEKEDIIKDSRENINEKEDKAEVKDTIESNANEKEYATKGLDESNVLEDKTEALKSQKDSGVEEEVKQNDGDTGRENNVYNEEIDYAPLPEHIYGDGIFFGVDELVSNIISDDTASDKGEIIVDAPQGGEKKDETAMVSRDDAVSKVRADERIEKTEKLSTDSNKENTNKEHTNKEHSNRENSNKMPSDDSGKAEDKTADNLNKEDREAIQVELSVDAENEMRRQINDNLTVEQIVAIKQGMEEQMRERICIEEAVFAAEENAKQNVKSEAVQTKSETKQSNMVDRR